ncbi:MAG: HNH endonuclease [Desulfovibrio sp.]|nr:HNH endonuclease [Desulfovibrio sp.]
MCHLADAHAIFLIEKAISLQKDNEILNHLKDALAEIVCDKEAEYDQIEMETINKIVEDISISMEPKWEGKREIQAMVTSSKTGRELPKRDPQRAADALRYAGYKCEFNNGDRTFPRKNGIPYTEPHHLIPISNYRDFTYSVDVIENIVSLCSHCHNLLHYGRFEDKKMILMKLYDERKDALRTCCLNINFEQLIMYYK